MDVTGSRGYPTKTVPYEYQYEAIQNESVLVECASHVEPCFFTHGINKIVHWRMQCCSNLTCLGGKRNLQGWLTKSKNEIKEMRKTDDIQGAGRMHTPVSSR